jgi:hypothetical protein
MIYLFVDVFHRAGKLGITKESTIQLVCAVIPHVSDEASQALLGYEMRT